MLNILKTMQTPTQHRLVIFEWVEFGGVLPYILLSAVFIVTSLK